MPFYVYVIKSTSRTLRYIGQTDNVESRLCFHNMGLSPFTKNKGPWVLIYSEVFETRSQAVLRERFLKSGKGRQWLDEMENK